jgi:hypothetical protein
MKWSQIKRVISFTLCLLMVLTLLPTGVLADDTVAPAETSVPAVTETSSESTPAPSDATEATPTPSDAEEATPTPSDADEVTPTPSVSDDGSEEPATYVINFVIDGQTVWDMQQIVAEGGTVTAPRDPAVPDGEAYAGQEFLYWYARAAEAYDFGTPVTANLVLIAKFGVLEDAPADEEEPLADDGEPFAAFSMAGGILPESTPLWTYTFVVDGVTVATKIIANGDTLDAPEAPAAPEGQKFSGWYTSANTLFLSFGSQTVTEDGATTLTAQFEQAYYVFFRNQFGSIIETRTPDSSGIVSTANVTSFQLASDEAMMGWSLTADGSTPVGESVTVDGANINLYPIIQNVVWITFDSAGGTYISPMYIQPNTALTQAAVDAYVATQNGGSSTITKPGYSFSNWSGFSFGTIPTGTVMLTANWTANLVSYTVLFWQQAVEGASYAIVAAHTVTRQAYSGATVSASAADGNKNYIGFDYNAAATASVTVHGDGSTVLNVYYDRQTWTINWLMRTRNASNAYTNNGAYYNWVTRSGRYGSTIEYWPVASEISSYYSGGMSGYTHTGWLINSISSGIKLSYLELYDDGGTQMFYSGVLNLYAQYTDTGITTDTFRHFRQELNLSWPSTPYVIAYGYNVSNFNISNRFVGFTAAFYNTNTNSTLATRDRGHDQRSAWQHRYAKYSPYAQQL